MNDANRIREIVRDEISRSEAREWPNKLEWFMCPECKTQTLAMKFIPKSRFPSCSMEFGGHVTYGFIEMTHMTMIGRQCIICKKKFVPSIPQPPKDSYVEGE